MKMGRLDRRSCSTAVWLTRFLLTRSLGWALLMSSSLCATSGVPANEQLESAIRTETAGFERPAAEIGLPSERLRARLRPAERAVSTGARVDAAPGEALQAMRSRFRSARWKDLPGWGQDPLGPALQAFLRSCAVLGRAQNWKSACQAATHLPATADEQRLRKFFESDFTPWQVIDRDGRKTGLITGYYEPLLHGSRTPSERYRYPLYAPPADMLTIDLSSAYPEFNDKSLRGRLQSGRVVPYFSRQEIEAPNSPLKGRELVWVDDRIDAFFLHAQGSGRVELDTGETVHIGYADQNGHPFRSVGRYLIAKSEMRPQQISMQGIKSWARANPGKVDTFFNFNPRYVFFRELPANLPGPIGTLGVPLTAQRSIAIDAHFIPLGAPVYLSTTHPRSSRPLNRLMLAQDTGGSIRGGLRSDVFWGFGEEAGQLADAMMERGRMWVLLPRKAPDAHPARARSRARSWAW
jgi:membrane-bound lytic murein transglycosylase A